MPKGTTTDNEFLKAVFLKADPGWRLNANVYIALHSANPGAGGVQTTSEMVYDLYARVAVPTTALGWTDGGATFDNAALIQFPQCGPLMGDTAKYVSIGIAALPGAGQILYVGALGADLIISNLIVPQFAIGALDVTEA
jgi:hypothetical protein